jgi:predicted RNA-binding protein with PUA domain
VNTSAEQFGTCFKEICKQSNVLIADNCPQNEKAFELQQSGIVLGIGFDSRKLEWFLPKKKGGQDQKQHSNSLIERIHKFRFRVDFFSRLGVVSLSCEWNWAITQLLL